MNNGTDSKTRRAQVAGSEPNATDGQERNEAPEADRELVERADLEVLERAEKWLATYSEENAATYPLIRDLRNHLAGATNELERALRSRAAPAAPTGLKYDLDGNIVRRIDDMTMGRR